MSIFFGKKEEAVLFSQLEGTLTYQGKPASGAKITLWTAWKDQKGETDDYRADDTGYFKIPTKTVTYRDHPLVQMSIGQTVTVEYQGQEYVIWEAGKTSTHLYGELAGEPQGVTCELTQTELDHHLEHSLLGTICKWESLKKLESEQ